MWHHVCIVPYPAVVVEIAFAVTGGEFMLELSMLVLFAVCCLLLDYLLLAACFCFCCCFSPILSLFIVEYYSILRCLFGWSNSIPMFSLYILFGLRRSTGGSRRRRRNVRFGGETNGGSASPGGIQDRHARPGQAQKDAALAAGVHGIVIYGHDLKRQVLV